MNKIILVCGPAGCGKTTNVKSLSEIFKPSIVCDGEGVHIAELKTDKMRERSGSVVAMWLINAPLSKCDKNRLSKKGYSVESIDFFSVMSGRI